MNKQDAVRRLLLCSLLSGCSADGATEADEGAEDSARVVGAIGTFRGEFDADHRRIVFSAVDPQTLQPLASETGHKRFGTPVRDQDGISNSTSLPGASFEFQTNSYSSPPGDSRYPLPNFTGSITIRSFYDRPLDNVYAEITRLTPSSGTITACTNATSPCSALSAIPAPLSGLMDPANLSKGIWEYGTIAANGLQVRDWTWFGASNFTFYVVVKASIARTGYTTSAPTNNVSFVDACTLAGATSYDLADNLTAGPVTLPFPLTAWDKSSSTLLGVAPYALRIQANGYLNVGNSITSIAASNANMALPSGSAARNGIFAFWDDLVMADDSVCYAVQGSAPARSVVITWKNANVKSVPNSRVSFSAILHENTDVIDFLYAQPFSGNAASPTTYSPALLGASASMGAQNFNRNAAVGTSNAAWLSANAADYPQRVRLTPNE